MDRLASCYFCGTALDAPRDVPVVPADYRDGDPETTVALCPDCEGKLAPVVDRVAEVAASGPDDAPATEGTEATGEGDPSGTDEPSGPAGVEAVSFSDGRDAGAGEEAESDADDGTEAAGQSDGGEAAADETRAGGEGAADAEPAADEDDDATGRETRTSSEDRPPIDPMEYRRVVRLLENREFPVERSEVETLAESAYDLSPATCEAIVDAAIERGRVGTDGDMLVRPQ